MNPQTSSEISPERLEQILIRLGFNRAPEPTLDGLRELYAAWCQKVPFDNIRKLIHLRAGDPGPFPGSTAGDFFEAWLRHGTGGTCWAGSIALHALLTALGFPADRVVATMLVAPELPPNHGTVRVNFDGESYIVDSSILSGEPLLVSEKVTSSVTHPAWGIHCAMRDQRHHISWRPLHQLDGFECRLERFGAGAGEFPAFYEQTRVWSPFNYQLTARLNSGDEVLGLVMGKAVLLHADGGVSQGPASHAEAQRILLDEFKLSEEIVSQLPKDLPIPPPPGSETASRV